MATSLPTPGQLIVDNVTLLAGSPTAFNERYGHHLTPNTFAKPGNHGPANCLLHFLLCLIDPDLTEPLFKPCFPILDRDQERDFRRVVDSRLAVLEKTKLLPSGSARKSVIASGGGDRFLDLVWNLSTLAVQQACLRHPAYGSSSRLRMVSHNSRSEVLSHQSSTRSNRSLFSVVSTRSERPQDSQQAPPSSANAASRHRRFLGVGMLSASEQRARDAENARARIDAERVALERTVNVGKEGATTWASEADSLREKIGQFEANLARLKGQLADMGFDENGVDIRGNDQAAQLSARPPTPPSKSALSAEPPSSVSDSSAKTSTSLTPNVVVVAPDNIPAPITSGSELRPSPSGDDFEHFKTSPFDSTESGSSVDDLQERDLSSDLSKLLTFSAETASARRDVEESLKNAKSLEEMSLTPRTGEDNAAASDIVNLVRAATTELQQATDRMDEIRRERARVNGENNCCKAAPIEPSSGPSAGKSKSPEENSAAAEISSSSVEAEPEILVAKKPDPVEEPADTPVSNDKPVSDNVAPLEQLATEAVEKHTQTVNAATKVRAEATRLSERSIDIIQETHARPYSTPVKSSSNGQEGKKWLTRSSADAASHSSDDVSSVASSNKPARASVDASRDLSLGSKALRNSTTAERTMRNNASFQIRRNRSAHRSLDSINLSANRPKSKNISPRYDTNCCVAPSPAAHVAPVKASRCVRFAELPPSYTRSRDTERGPANAPANARPARLATEVHPSRSGSPSEPKKPKEDARSNRVKGNTLKFEEAVGQDDKHAVSSEKEELKKTDVHSAETPRPVQAHKPPRLQRRQTPHRIMSQKDVFQRAAARGPRKETVPQRPGSGQLRTNQVISAKVRPADVEPEAVPVAVIDAPAARSLSPRPAGIKIRPSSVALVTTNRAASESSSSSGGSISPKSSKDDISVRPKPRVSRQRSDMSEPGPISERSKAFSSPPPIQFKPSDKLAVPPVSLSASMESGDAATSSEIRAAPDVDTSAPEPSMPKVDGKADSDNGDSGLDGSSSSSGNMTEPFAVPKSDSSGSMIGSSEDWPGSQLSEEVQKSSMSAPETTPTRTTKSHSRKAGLLRKSSGGMFGTFHVGKSRITSSLKDGSSVAATSDSADSLVSGGRPPLPQKSTPNRASSGGFFAGETAQWQENVRSHSNTDGAPTDGSPRRSDEPGGGVRSGRGGATVRAASANPPARKSRVHSFRARLAALK